MSETLTGSSASAPNGGLYDATGNPIQRGGGLEQTLEPLVQFAKEQPVTTALGALVVGYVLGKIF